MVYAAATAALAVLEVRVHLDLPPDLIPDDYVLVTIDVGDADVEIVSFMPAQPRDFGDAWLAERRTPVLQVPSAIVPESPNLLINPAHPGAARISIVAQRGFSFDRKKSKAFFSEEKKQKTFKHLGGPLRTDRASE
jgi:RES domain-containing protein